jgi:predicted AAA+ superfamily ATPase
MALKREIQTAYTMQQARRLNASEKHLREKEKKIQIENSFIQVITGVRRCGKSTLLNLLMSKYSKVAYFNFEDPRIIDFQVSDFSKLDEIIPNDTEAYFFDEIQNVSQWEIYIRQLHDYEKKVFVTGSNASLLSKDLGTRLTGRYLATELFPFSYAEFLSFTKAENTDKAVEKYLKVGGFPENIKTNNVEVLQNLFKDIVFRDIAIRYSIRNTKLLIDLALYLLSNIGKETTYNSLKKTFQVGSANTIMDYLNWFEDAYLLFFLQKFSYSAKSIAINPRKVYAIDNGLIHANSLSFSSDKGRILENAVYIHLRNQGVKMYYFRENRECDFVLFNQEKCVKVLQVCHEIHSENQERELSGLLEAMQFFELKEGFIITFNQKDTIQKDNKTIHLIPAAEFFVEEII